MEVMKATALSFEKRYSDDSGIEYGVRLDGDYFELEAVNIVRYPIEQLDWVIAALQRIRAERVLPSAPGAGAA